MKPDDPRWAEVRSFTRHNRRWPRLLCLVWTAGLLSLWLLSGCSSLSQPDFSRLPLPWRADAAEDAAVPLRLLVWDEGEQTERLRQALADFEAQTPGVAVELVVADGYEAEVQRRMAEQTLPDLLLVDSFHFPALVAEGRLSPAQGRLDAEDDFYTKLVDAFRHDGSLYCLPREVRTLVLIYARADFAPKGLEPPRTWDETRQIAEELTDLNTGSFGLIVSPDLSRWLPFLYQAGGEIMDAEGRMALDTPAAAAALDYYIAIFRDNFAGQPGESNSSWAGEVLGKRKGSMAVEGNWIVPYFADNFPDFSYGIAPLPSGPGGRGSVAFTSCYVVSAASSRPDQAFALANFLTSTEIMQSLTSTPAFMPTRLSLRAVWIDQFPALSPFLDALPDARVWQLPPGFDAFLRTFNRSMLTLYSADIEAADLLDNMQRLGTLILSRQRD